MKLHHMVFKKNYLPKIIVWPQNFNFGNVSAILENAKLSNFWSYMEENTHAPSLHVKYTLIIIFVFTIIIHVLESIRLLGC